MILIIFCTDSYVTKYITVFVNKVKLKACLHFQSWADIFEYIRGTNNWFSAQRRILKYFFAAENVVKLYTQLFSLNFLWRFQPGTLILLMVPNTVLVVNTFVCVHLFDSFENSQVHAVVNS